LHWQAVRWGVISIRALGRADIEVLSLKISDRDKARMHDLAVRNQDDALTPAEKEEMHAFGKAATLLSILKSKARRTLGIKLETRTVS
jgi:hypothetical protein